MIMTPEFWVAVAFVIFLVLLAYLGVHKTINDTLDKRSSRIQSELDEAARLKKEAMALLAEYKQKTANAEQEAAAIIEGAKADAERLAAEAAVSAAEKVLAHTTKGSVANQLIARGIEDVKKKLN